MDFRDAMWSTQVKKKDEREINQEGKNFLVDLNVNYAGCITFTRRLISLSIIVNVDLRAIYVTQDREILNRWRKFKAESIQPPSSSF